MQGMGEPQILNARAEAFARRLTPSGRGAVASIRLTGPSAVSLAEQLFQPAGRVIPLADLPTDRIALGGWSLPAGAHEEVVLRRVDAETIEIHCHGGEACVAGVLESLRQAGATIESVEQGATAAEELRLVLSKCRTERTAAIVLDQLYGAFDREVEQLARDLNDPNLRPTAIVRLGVLQELALLGRHLVEPWKVVLAGLPNVGKSSLINALVGFRRAIVHATPGTTRDVVTAETAFEGWPVELSDTAGQRAGESAIESAGVEQARRHADEADLVVLVLDASQPASPEEDALRRKWPAALVIYNKLDLPAGRTLDPSELTVSAAQGLGLSELVAAVARRLVPAVPPAGTAVPVTRDHLRRLDLLAR